MPHEPSVLALFGVFLVAMLGGGINSIAAGGTLLTYPALVALGVPPYSANATCAIGFLPSALSSMWGYRDALQGAGQWGRRITLPCMIGGGLGAWLFLSTPPDDFARIVPILVLVATLLFMAQDTVMRRLAVRRGELSPSDDGSRGFVDPQAPGWAFLSVQLAMGVYGGYFGAGIGIVLLAGLGLMGFTHIHRMNGLKNWATISMNIPAATMFILAGIVNWHVAVVLAAGGLVGGYSGSRVAQKVGQRWVRRAVVVIGLAAFVFLLLRPL
jgi:uncharacterized membrane protein YfcA